MASSSRIPLGRAYLLASTMLREARRGRVPAAQIQPVGSLRRSAPDLGDVSLLALTEPGGQVAFVDAFCRLPIVTEVLERRSTCAVVQTDRGAVTCHVTTPDCYGASLVWHTGSRAHTSQLQARASRCGFTFASGALRGSAGAIIPTPTEEALYEKLELQFVPPELREGLDELDVAESDAVPVLISELHIRGDLHMHTTWSDGRNTTEEMVRAARELGYEYVAITDHSERAWSSRKLSVSDVPRQRDEIHQLRSRVNGIEVLHGVEVDIMKDGSLDFDDELLAQFDIVLASLHDHGGQGPDELTERYLRAIRHPLVNIITHPANRSPAQSTGYDLEFDVLFSEAARTGTAMEIDGAPGHLDMDGRLARRAVAAGVTIVVDSDCHRADALGRQMRFGIATARRGWIEPHHVLNTRPVSAVRDFVARKRALAGR